MAENPDCPHPNPGWYACTQAAGETFWYRGTPISVKGQAVGTLCLANPGGKPDNFETKYLRFVTHAVERMSLAVE